MARKARSEKPATGGAAKGGSTAERELRIVGGRFRGRRLRYHGDRVVRPMKERVREAIFNLISTNSTGRYVIDLFAGTGAMGLEALSRGADTATFIEKHVPSARVVEENIAALGVEERCTLTVTSAFLWVRRDLPQIAADPKTPWLVFCCPPYAFYTERQADMLALIQTVLDRAPTGSTFVVEADARFDFQLLPGDWDVRTYPPAVVGLAWR